MNGIRVLVSVRAGVMPGVADETYTRAYELSGQRWEAAVEGGQHDVLLAELNGRAQGYAGLLMLSPEKVNWVQVEWMWM